jgi:hypothetical protein
LGADSNRYLSYDEVKSISGYGNFVFTDRNSDGTLDNTQFAAFEKNLSAEYRGHLSAVNAPQKTDEVKQRRRTQLLRALLNYLVCH